jgi:hypothetical protein
VGFEPTISVLERARTVRALDRADVYDYIIKSCRQQAEVIQNHENENVCYIGQSEAQHRKYKRLKLGGGHVCDRCGLSY